MTKLALSGLLIAAALALPATSQAQTNDPSATLAVRPESRLWIEGSSNLHEGSCKATKLDAAIVVDADWEKEMKADVLNVSKLLKRVDVQVPVSALKCGKDKMDELMKKALKE